MYRAINTTWNTANMTHKITYIQNAYTTWREIEDVAKKAPLLIAQIVHCRETSNENTRNHQYALLSIGSETHTKAKNPSILLFPRLLPNVILSIELWTFQIAPIINNEMNSKFSRFLLSNPHTHTHIYFDLRQPIWVRGLFAAETASNLAGRPIRSKATDAIMVGQTLQSNGTRHVSYNVFRHNNPWNNIRDAQ